MNKNKTTITFIFSIVVTLFAFGAFILFFKIIKNKNEHTSSVLVNLENKILRKRNTSTLSQKIAEVDATAQIIDSHFVNEKEIDSFVNYLESLGTSAKTALIVESVEVSASAKNTITFKISAEGDFSNVISTIKLLENAPYKIHIQQVFLNKRLKVVTEDVKGVQTSKQIPVWHTDISFNILSSS